MSTQSDNPLFIPLKTEYYEAFKWGTKTVEYRRYGPRWNKKTCYVGRAVVLSKGYGKQDRVHGTIIGFQRRFVSNPAWLDCYGEPDYAACIRIKVKGIQK